MKNTVKTLVAVAAIFGAISCGETAPAADAVPAVDTAAATVDTAAAAPADTTAAAPAAADTTAAAKH